MSTIDKPRILSKSGEQPAEIYFTERPGSSIENLVKDSCSQIPRELTSRLGHEKDVCKFPEPGQTACSYFITQLILIYPFTDSNYKLWVHVIISRYPDPMPLLFGTSITRRRRGSIFG